VKVEMGVMNGYECNSQISTTTQLFKLGLKLKVMMQDSNKGATFNVLNTSHLGFITYKSC
jgi:hypothetical protein